MGVWTMPWAQQCMVEANRFWFYSLLFSIVLCVMQLLEGSRVPAEKESGGNKLKKDEKKSLRVRRRIIVSRLLTDGFDLFIPGSITGWIHTSPAFVGFAGMLSTLLASKEIWDRFKDI